MESAALINSQYYVCAYFQRDYALETVIAQILVEGYTNVWLACAMKMFYFIQKIVLNWFSLWFMKLVCSSLFSV